MITYIQAVDLSFESGMITVRIQSFPGSKLLWQIVFARSLPAVLRNPLEFPDDHGTVVIGNDGRGSFISDAKPDRYKRGCRVSVYSLKGELLATKEMLM